MNKYLSILLFFGLTRGDKTNIAIFNFENNGLSEVEIRALLIKSL